MPTEPTTSTETPTETPTAKPEVVEDPYLWLEDVGGDRSLAWARERNAKSEGEITKVASFEKTRDRIRAILDSKDKIPSVNKRGNHYYNFWQDEKNPRTRRSRPTSARARGAAGITEQPTTSCRARSASSRASSSFAAPTES